MSLKFNGQVFVPDLGADEIWRLVNDVAPGKFKVQEQIDIEVGSGPHHITIHGGILFTMNELTSMLTAQQIPTTPNDAALPLLTNISIMPPDDVQQHLRRRRDPHLDSVREVPHSDHLHEQPEPQGPSSTSAGTPPRSPHARFPKQFNPPITLAWSPYTIHNILGCIV